MASIISISVSNKQSAIALDPFSIIVSFMPYSSWRLLFSHSS